MSKNLQYQNKLTVLSDVHIGTIRSAGTTPVSQYGLRKDILVEFKKLLPVAGDLMILGDLFDTGNIPISDVFETYMLLNNWLNSHTESTLYNVTGNHDVTKTSNILSSFQFLGKLLSMSQPTRYKHIEAPTMTPHGYVIPHLRNQELFDLAVEDVPECDFLFVHCNYDNNFAAQSDQSLNLSKEQVRKCKAKKVVFAHEHHGRDADKVCIPGNQVATSVSDWLSNQPKRFLTIEDGKASYVVCAQRHDNFVELDWRDLKETDHKFIRVSGEAKADEAADVVNAINRLRKSSKAFVITNAVTISTGNIKVDFDSTLASVQRFSVMEALKEIMTTAEMSVLESL